MIQQEMVFILPPLKKKSLPNHLKQKKVWSFTTNEVLRSPLSDSVPLDLLEKDLMSPQQDRTGEGKAQASGPPGPRGSHISHHKASANCPQLC